MKLYRDFVDQAAIDYQYDPSTHAADGPAHMAEWQERAKAALERLDGELGVAYGPTLAEHVDIFPAGDQAPVHLFIHGGYWRRFAARDFAWVAEPLVARGITCVNVNYALCPTVSLTEIVRQTRAAIAWCYREVGRYGGNSERLSLSGHSAGGHLAAMVLTTDWLGDYGLPKDLLRGTVSISGLYDLGPFPFSYLQPSLQLSTDEVLKLSPLALEPTVRAPLLVAVGGDESAEFRRQSNTFAERWEQNGVDCRVMVEEGADHFQVLDALFADNSTLLDEIKRW